jgi:hypothetical protein
MSSTIRHNRARGKHQVDAMSEIVLELKNRNWRNARIAKELGMDEEEVLRLCQVSGLTSLFSDQDFSRAWESEDAITDQMEDLNEDVDDCLIASTRIPNENKGDRIFHTYDKWECHKAGFFETGVEGKSKAECEEEFADFFRDVSAFRVAADYIVDNWTYSCEHYLSNFAMNRIAWLGQASACYAAGIPSRFCSGFSQLTHEEQVAANEVALKAINRWMSKNGRPELSMDEALTTGRQVEIY